MTHNRIALVVASLVVLSAAVTPASAAFGFDDGPTLDHAERYGQPTFVVSYSEDGLSDLREWTDSNDDRRLVSFDNSSGTATVAAPLSEVNAGFFDRILSVQSLDDARQLFDGDMLSGLNAVESIQPNYVHSYAEPVGMLDKESNATIPQLGITEYGDPEYPLDGVAFSGDANKTYMGTSRDVLGVDNVSSDVDGAGVLVANIDTGTNVNDGTVFGDGSSGSEIRISDASKSFITNKTVAESGWSAIADGSGHGTWTSAAVAADTANDTHDGVAPSARLLVLKALADDGSGSTSDIASAIRYAADHDADVVTMSLGSPVYDEAIVSAIDYAYANGVEVITVAAGNSRSMRSPGIASPGDAEDVITVAATTGEEPNEAESAYFSQYGPDTGATDLSNGQSRGAGIDVAAPGMATVAQVPVEGSERTQLSKLSGTSMATPMVAGGAALLVDAHPNWENETYRDWIRDGARPIPKATVSEVGEGMFAVDNSLTRTDPEREQAGAMTDGAEARDDFQRALAGDSSFWFSFDVSAVV